MGNYLDVFKEFYLRNHSGRKLQYQPTLGHCVLRGGFTHVQEECMWKHHALLTVPKINIKLLLIFSVCNINMRNSIHVAYIYNVLEKKLWWNSLSWWKFQTVCHYMYMYVHSYAGHNYTEHFVLEVHVY